MAPSIKPMMKRFMGFQVGEVAISLLKKVVESDRPDQITRNYCNLVASGHLQKIEVEQPNRVGFALTDKGRQYVIPMENNCTRLQ